PTLDELGIGFVPFSPLGRVSSRAQSTRTRSSIAPIFATSFPVSTRRTGKRTRPSWTCLATLRGKRRLHRRRSRLPGCLLRNRGLSRFPELQSCIGLKRIWAQRTSNCPRRSSALSPQLSRRSQCKEIDTPRICSRESIVDLGGHSDNRFRTPSTPHTS